MPQISSKIDLIENQIKCTDGSGQILKLSQNFYVYDIDIHTNEMELDGIKNLNEVVVGDNELSSTLKTIQIDQAEKEVPFGAESYNISSNINSNSKATHNELAELGNEQHQPYTITEYSCHRCRAVYDSRAKFEEHYKQAYNERPIYTCAFKNCGKHFKNKRSYSRHLNRHSKLSQAADSTTLVVNNRAHSHHVRTHHPQNNKTHQCFHCGKIMKNRSSLNMHLRIHTNDKPFGCMIDGCDRQFVQKINLMNHSKVHNTVKNYNCSECEKSFVSQSQLKRHSIQHLQIRSFECSFSSCNKNFRTNRDLKLHSMIHNPIRPHKCDQCAKSFLSSSKLKQHLNVHSGERPYKCAYCVRSFTNFSNWLKHLRRRHHIDHRTGKRLEVMPNYLNKSTNKAPKSATAKNKTANSVPASTKPEMFDNKATNRQTEPESTHKLPDKSTNNDYKILSNEYSSLKTTSEYDLSSTITLVDNGITRTLPLKTSDDLERAASLLMQQTLDVDDIEYENVIKSETSFEPPLINYGNSHHIAGDYANKMPSTDSMHYTDDFALHSLQMDLFQSNYRCSMNSQDLDFMYSQSTQCDFRMLPLPPINTVKRKLTAVVESQTPTSSTTTTTAKIPFTSMANV